MFKYKNIFLTLLLALITQACVQLQLNSPALPTPRTIETVSQTESNPTISPTENLIPTATQEIIVPIATLTNVSITAIKGNLNIRRGPSLSYNSIAVLYKNTSAKVIAHDVLTKWAQIEIPNSDQTGWVSLLTDYSSVAGDLDTLLGFTVTDWPQIAYLRNCTHHEMYIMPGGIILPSSFASPENEIVLNPGHYFVFDFDMPDLPEVKSFEIREGQQVDVTDDGSGEHRLCQK